MIIDTHTHIQFPAYDEDREAVILRSREAGVKMIAVGTQARTSEDAIRAAEQWPDDILGASVGFHPGHTRGDSHHDPQEIAEPSGEKFDYQKFFALARQPRVIAIGECGLDYYRIGDGGQGTADGVKDGQKEIFIKQIELARDVKKPLAIHCRDAFANLVEILSATRDSLTPYGNGVIHFFSGSRDDARKLLDLDFFLGFGGVITFTSAYDDLIHYVPIDRILIETDAPYVAPAPYRGKRNEPSYVIEVAKRIAALKGIEYDGVAEKTLKNTRALFGLNES